MENSSSLGLELIWRRKK